MTRLRASGNSPDGTVRLQGAHIRGQLSLSEAELTNEAGPAFHCDGLQVDGGLVLSGVRATGHTESGALRLPKAHIAPELSLDNATLINKTGPALFGEMLRINGDMFLRDKFKRMGTVKTVRYGYREPMSLDNYLYVTPS
jgi:hypothetical protein